MVLAVFCFLTRGTDSDDIDSVAFHLKAAGQVLQRREHPEILLFDVGDGLAMRAHHVMVKVAVEFDPERAVVHAKFFQHACVNEKMNVLVNRRERDCRYTLLDPRIDLFRTGVTGHRLHDLIQNLALVGRGEPMIRTKLTERLGVDASRRPH